MGSEANDVRPISAPNTGPDPRNVHQMPPPDGPADVRDRAPAPGSPDPGFHYGGLAPMTPADAGPVAGRITQPDGPTDARDLTAPPTAPDPGFQYGGLAPMTAADAGPAPQGAAIERPDHPVDVRDLDPAPGTPAGPSGGGGVQTMAGGGGGVGTTSGFSGVDDPGELGRAGNNAQEMAGIVRSRGTVEDDAKLLMGVGALAGDLWGGDLGLALKQAMESWDKQAAKLARACQQIGEQCTATANNHIRTESANESEMNAVHASLPDFN